MNLLQDKRERQFLIELELFFLLKACISEKLQIKYKGKWKGELVKMIQGKKYIRSIQKYIKSVDSDFRLGVKVTNENRRKIEGIGFSGLEAGQAMFPPIVGRFTRFNIEGKLNIRRDLPKETIYVSMYSTRREFRGEKSNRIGNRLYRYPTKGL